MRYPSFLVYVMDLGAFGSQTTSGLWLDLELIYLGPGLVSTTTNI